MENMTAQDLINVPVINTRNNREGVAEKVNDEMWSVIFNDNGEQKDVSVATFKRWYKVLDQQAEEVINNDPVEQAVAEKVNKSTTTEHNTTNYMDAANPFTDEVKPIEHKALPARQQDHLNTLTIIQFRQTFVHIKDHTGFIVDVRVLDANDKLEYKSPKSSIGDTLQNYFKLEGDDLKLAKRAFTQARKYASEQLFSDYGFHNGVPVHISQATHE